MVETKNLVNLAGLGNAVHVVASHLFPLHFIFFLTFETASSKYNVPFPHSSLPDNIHYQSAWVDQYNLNHYKHPSVYNVRAFNTDWPKGYETDENVHLAGVMKAVRDICSKETFSSCHRSYINVRYTGHCDHRQKKQLYFCLHWHHAGV